MENLGWIIVTIFIPALAPVVLNLIMLAVPVGNRKNRKWYSQLKDGQLNWVSIALACAALHEIPDNLPWEGWFRGALIVCLIAACFFGAIGSAWPATPRDPSARWINRTGLMSISMIILGIVGCTATIIHIVPRS